MNIPALHDEYCLLTGLQLRYMHLEHASDWYLWSKDFDIEDLRLVVPWLKARYKTKPDILKNTLMFRHLIRCKDYFGEYLAQAKADARKPKPTERDKILKATGRPEAKPDKTTTPKDILQGSGLLPVPQREVPSADPIAPAALHSFPKPKWQEDLDKFKKEMGWK